MDRPCHRFEVEEDTPGVEEVWRAHWALVDNICPQCGRTFVDTEGWPTGALCLDCDAESPPADTHSGVYVFPFLGGSFRDGS
jgi:hypothetical protein